MKPVQLLLLLLAAGCARAPAQGNQMPPDQAPQPDPVTRPDVAQEALMDRIEREVRLPQGATELATYSRHYAWHEESGVRSVVAIYDRLSSTGPGGRHWVTERELPLIMDGGCGVISLSYDLATQRITRIACNGDA